MRIAIFLPALHGGGAERNMLILARGLADRGHNVTLLLGKKEGPYSVDELPSVRIVEFGCSPVILTLPGLVRSLRAAQYDVLLSTLPHANVVAITARWLSRSRTKVVVREANTISQVRANSRSLKGKTMPHFVRVFYRWSDRIIAVSTGSATDLANLLGRTRDSIPVVYNPVVTREMLAASRAPLRHPWFESGGPPVILGAGSLVPQKDFSTLIRATAALSERLPCRLMILGDGPERPELESLATALGIRSQVSLPGFVNNPFHYMRSADVFVLSSRWEGLPNVLIQAMAVGTPVVSTDCPSGPREILCDGRYGQLVPTGEPLDLAQAIAKTLEAPTATDELEARSLDFRAEKIIDHYLSLFEEVVGRRAGLPP